MRIAHILTCLLQGGAEENTIATANAQACRGHDVFLIHGNEVNQAAAAMVSASVKKVAVDRMVRPIRPKHDVAALKGLTEALREIDPDVVHTHQSKAGVLGRLAASRAKVPIIIHGVHILPFDNVSSMQKSVYLFAERLAARVTDAFISVSHGVRDENLRAGLGSPESNYVVYSGMDLSRFDKPAPIDEVPKGRLLVMVASLEPRKRQMEFLDVFASLAGRHPDLQIAFLGSGEILQALVKRADELGVGSRCFFPGFRKDAERWIARAAICLLCSTREGLPRVVVQYLAVGKPVVATSVPGLNEILTDGVDGLVVSSRDVKDMAAPLDRLLTSDTLLNEMTKAAKKKDVSRWSVDLMEPEVERVLREVARRKLMTWYVPGNSGISDA